MVTVAIRALEFEYLVKIPSDSDSDTTVLVLTVMLLKIQGFWDVTLCYWVSTSGLNLAFGK
jgi:hypothetical protein